MTDPEISPEYTVTFAAGVDDVLRACLKRLATTLNAETQAETYEHLAELRKDAITQISSFLRAFVGSLLHSTPHDGNVHLFVDGPESLFFRYDSGYHGAMILHSAGAEPGKASWSVHT